jgi:hypothetical protein
MAVSSVDSTTSSTVLANVNTSRKQLIIHNDDANALYVLLDSAAASATNYSFALIEGASACISDYGGEVRGIWAGDGTGAAKITELF